MTLGAALVSCSMVIPAVALSTAPTAAAATTSYPDVPAEPVPFGDAGFFGSMAGVQLNAPVVGMAVDTGRKGLLARSRRRRGVQLR